MRLQGRAGGFAFPPLSTRPTLPRRWFLSSATSFCTTSASQNLAARLQWRRGWPWLRSTPPISSFPSWFSLGCSTVGSFPQLPGVTSRGNRNRNSCKIWTLQRCGRELRIVFLRECIFVISHLSCNYYSGNFYSVLQWIDMQ